MSERKNVAVFLSAPPTDAERELRAIREEHPDCRLTVWLREAHRREYEDLLQDCFVHSDKPVGSKRKFVRELRSHFYHEALVLDFGQWSFWPARCLFFLSRADKKIVHTERGRFEFSFTKPFVLLKHLLYRSKNRSGSVAGMPPGTPLPFLFAAYRKTLGLLFGIVWCTLEFAWRRVTSPAR